MVLLVSHNWPDEVVVLFVFLLLTVRADPVTTWPDELVVLIADLLSIVLVALVILLRLSKADWPSDMLPLQMPPGIIVQGNVLALWTHFPR